MFWVELRLRVCMWDPAHGKPYASAQLELSFGVRGVEACFHAGTAKMEPGSLELYPYHFFIESSVEKHAALALILSSNKMLLHVTLMQRSKVIRIFSVWHHWFLFMKIIWCVIYFKGVSPFYQVGCLKHQLLPSSLPPADLSLTSPERVREVGRIFVLPGATGSLCHPLTQTAGSALHTRIIRR